MAQKVNSGKFVEFLQNCIDTSCGYIMGSKGQDPKKWATNSWWYTQYEGAQREKALWWREHAPRVFDCNGLMEGYYEDCTGIDINSKARYNYSDWCADAHGTDMDELPRCRRGGVHPFEQRRVHHSMWDIWSGLWTRTSLTATGMSLKRVASCTASSGRA